MIQNAPTSPARTSRRPAALLIALCFLLLPVVGAAAASEEMVRSFPLDPDGSVTLENINGDAVIEGWDRDEVSVEAVLTADDQATLDKLEVAIDATPRRIRIETEYPSGSYGRLNVDYTLRVPRGARLDAIELVNGSLTLRGLSGSITAELVNGRVTATELSGDVELTTVNGKVEVTLDALAPGRDVTRESVNGSIELAIAGAVDADVEASTVHGRIRNDFGLEEEKGRWIGSNLEGTLGAGGSRITLENVNGSIEIRRAE